MPSFKASCLNFVLKLSSSSPISMFTEYLLKEVGKEDALAPVPIPASLTATFDILEEEVDVGEGKTFRVIRFRNRAWKEDAPQKAIFFTPGGGFVSKALPMHYNFLSVLLPRLPSYTLYLVDVAPTYQSNLVTSGLLKVFRHLEGKADKWTTMGDSAGGNSALVLTNSVAKEDGKATKIRKCVLISALVDIRLTPEVEKAAESDFVLGLGTLPWKALHFYVSPGVSHSDPSVSPVEGVDALAHTGINVQSWMGTRDMCHTGVVYLEKKLKEVPGVEMDFHLVDGMFHDYPIIISQWIPEARDAVDGMVRLLSK